MFQYALNDSKLIIYLFLLMIGLYFSLCNWEKILSPEEIASDSFYFKRLTNKFVENKENFDKLKVVKSNENEIQYIFLRTYLECLRTVNLRLSDQNYFNILKIQNK